MIFIKILVVFCVIATLICITAYIELHRTMTWYKKQYEQQPRMPYRMTPKCSWQQRFINTLLLRKTHTQRTVLSSYAISKTPNPVSTA